MRIMNSTLKRSSVVILGGLVAFRPVPSVGEWVFCLLLLWDSETAVWDGSEVVACYVILVSGLHSSGGKLASRGGFLDEEEIEEYNKQDEGGERFKHESRGKVRALSFCQRLIQLWLRSRLKQQCLLSKGDFKWGKRVVRLGSIDQLKAEDLDVCTWTIYTRYWRTCYNPIGR